MKTSERTVYLLIILGLVSFMSYELWWFTGHYAYLESILDIVFKNCKY